MSDVTYLFVKRQCRHCSELLLWIRRAKDSGAFTCPNLRVVVVDDLACGGVARRIRRVPSLVAKGMREPAYGLSNIKRHLGGEDPPRRQEPTQRRRSDAYRAPIPKAGPPPPPTTPYGDGRGLPVGLDDSRCKSVPFHQFPRPQRSVQLPTDETSTNTSIRERKVASLEDDLETLIAARNRLGSRGISRV